MKILLNKNLAPIAGNNFSSEELFKARDNGTEFEVQRLANGGVWFSFMGELVKVWEHEYSIIDKENVPDFANNIKKEYSVGKDHQNRMKYTGVMTGENLTRTLRKVANIEAFKDFFNEFDFSDEALQLVIDGEAIFLDPNERGDTYQKIDITFMKDITYWGNYWESELLIVNEKRWKNVLGSIERGNTDVNTYEDYIKGKEEQYQKIVDLKVAVKKKEIGQSNPVDYVSSDKELERIGKNRWKQAMEKEEIETDEHVSFFGWVSPEGNWYSCDFGGHSTLAAQILSMLKEDFNYEKDYHMSSFELVSMLLDEGFIQVQSFMRGKTFFGKILKDASCIRCTTKQYETLYQHCQKYPEYIDELGGFLEEVQIV